MTAFDSEPVAKAGQVLKLQPASSFEQPLREVQSVEQTGKHPRHDFGSIAANDVATEDNDEDVYMDELEMKQGQLGQWQVDVLSPVEIEVAQTGSAANRFESANNVGRITPDQPPAQRRVFVLDDDAPYFVVNNPRSDARDAAYVAFPVGFKFDYRTIAQGDLGSRQPISVPVSRIEAQTQSAAGQRQSQSQSAGQGSVIDRHSRGDD